MSDNKNTQETLNEKLVNGMKGLGRFLSKPFSKKLKKKAVAIGKKALKAAIKVILKVLKQILSWIIGTVGVPGILIILGTIIVTVLISVALSFFWTTDSKLSGDDAKIQAYIKEQSQSTVNMNSELERPYRVPEGLISSTIMLDFFEQKDYSLKQTKGIIKNMATKLAPEFEYGQYDEWKEKQVIVCEEGKKCDVGKIQHTKNMVTKLNSVEYWNGSTIFTYKPKVTAWKSNTVITHKTIKVDKKVEYWKALSVPAYLADQTDTYYPFFNSSSKSWKSLLAEEKRQEKYNVNTTGYTKVYLLKTKTVKVDKVIEVKTTTKTRQQYFDSSKQVTQDYANFDSILNSMGLGLDEKMLIEANYSFLEGDINYIDWLKGNGGVFGFDDISYDGDIIPGAGVPPQYMPIYLSAEKKYGVHWYTLAAIHSKETAFSTIKPMISYAGAVGHMQFLPSTWAGWKYNIGGGRVSSNTDITNLSVIKAGGGYGVDGNNDGKADPFTLEDAIFTAANYLSKNGYSKDKRKAIYQYNHADWYVNDVLARAEKFKTSATYSGGSDSPELNPGSFIRPTTGKVTSGFGARWGATHYGIDIGLGGRTNVKIYAVADGIVNRSYLSSSYGNVVYIQHTIGGKKYETVYAHMQNRAVSAGTKVKQGQFLGYMGSTGNVTGPHLHFEIHSPAWTSNKANAKNPALYIKF